MKPIKKASEMSVRELARYIDQSVLKPEFTQADIRKYSQEGIDFGCATICINPASLDMDKPVYLLSDPAYRSAVLHVAYLNSPITSLS